jgi:hypothetical protein
MRYIRFESKMKTGASIKTNSKSNLKSVIKRSEPKSKRRAMAPAARSKARRSGPESESTVSSEEPKSEAENEVEVENGSEACTVQRRTRGIKMNLKDASGSSDGDTESSFDGYEESAEQDDSDGDLSDIESATKARCPVRTTGTARPFRRSGSPPITPGRFVQAHKPSMPPLTPPSTQKSMVETTSAGSISDLDYHQQVKQEFSHLKSGMMMPISKPLSSTTAFHENSAGQVRYVNESDILESIEVDAEEERKDLEAVNARMSDSGGDEEEEEATEEDDGFKEEEEAQPEGTAQKTAMGPPPLPRAKKTMGYTSGCAPQ